MSSLRKKPQTFKDGGAVDADVVAPEDEAVAVLKKQIAALEQARVEEAARNQHSDASPAESLGESRRLKWLVASPLAQQFQGSLNHLHRQALEAGNADTSESYFRFMDNELARMASQRPGAEHIINEMEERIRADAARRQPEHKPEDERLNGSYVSAPVSREIPSNGARRYAGSLTLTPAQREAARMAGVSEKVYAEQLQRLMLAKEEGDTRYA